MLHEKTKKQNHTLRISPESLKLRTKVLLDFGTVSVNVAEDNKCHIFYFLLFFITFTFHCFSIFVNLLFLLLRSWKSTATLYCFPVLLGSIISEFTFFLPCYLTTSILYLLSYKLVCKLCAGHAYLFFCTFIPPNTMASNCCDNRSNTSSNLPHLFPAHLSIFYIASLFI